ncbi:MAG: flagellar export chaperone FlgN [Planctomycetota bacterium]
MSALLADRNRLEAALREELAAQRELLELLRAQESAVIARTPDALVEVTSKIEAHVSSASARRARREPIIRRIAMELRVAPSALTLSSLCERLGEDGSRLSELRLELREATSRVVRQNRRVSALVGLHRRINQEVLELVLADDGMNPFNGAGALVDAEV